MSFFFEALVNHAGVSSYTHIKRKPHVPVHNTYKRKQLVFSVSFFEVFFEALVSHAGVSSYTHITKKSHVPVHDIHITI